MAHVGVLPAYDQPPVVEVALAIQLESAIGYRPLDLALISNEWSDDLPVVQERQPIPPMMVEPESPSLALRVSGETETPRLWLMNEEGSRLVQLQQDRLVVNWRKLPAGVPYPRYLSIREFLIDTWNRLTKIVESLELVVPQPSICEVVYVNLVQAENGWSSIADTSRVIAPWSGTMTDDFLPSPRQAGFFLRYELPGGKGWLTIDGQSVSDSKDKNHFAMNLISRGSSMSPDFNGALQFMDLAHQWIVRGFTSVTAKEAHLNWRRTV